MSLDALSLTSRTRNALRRGGFTKVEEVLDIPLEQLFYLRNFGQKCFDDLLVALKAAELVPENYGLGLRASVISSEQKLGRDLRDMEERRKRCLLEAEGCASMIRVYRNMEGDERVDQWLNAPDPGGPLRRLPNYLSTFGSRQERLPTREEAEEFFDGIQADIGEDWQRRYGTDRCHFCGQDLYVAHASGGE